LRYQVGEERMDISRTKDLISKVYMTIKFNKERTDIRFRSRRQSEFEKDRMDIIIKEKD
jgi:hypothetical protein